MIPSLLHLLEDLPDAQSAEVIEILAESPGVRIGASLQEDSLRRILV